MKLFFMNVMSIAFFEMSLWRVVKPEGSSAGVGVTDPHSLLSRSWCNQEETGAEALLFAMMSPALTRQA